MDPVSIVFQTDRLKIRGAELDDAEFICSLWNDPALMTFVGFPEGLQTTPENVRKQIINTIDFLEALLIIETKNNDIIGQCKLGKPDSSKISQPDIKLLSEQQGKGYGTEIYMGLIKYLFSYMDCEIIQATPNVDNTASIRIQEKVGARLIKRDIFYFPNDMPVKTCPVEYFLFELKKSEFNKVSLNR
jgi:RimJ/RimL family protein N-acetyltransferase